LVGFALQMAPGISPSSTTAQIKEVETVQCLTLDGAICLFLGVQDHSFAHR